MWFFNKIPSHLPEAKGPFVPGCMDVMLEYSPTGLFMRLYYPTKVKQEEIDQTKWPTWFPDENYLIGMAKAIFIMPFMLRFARWWYSASNIRIPALFGEKVNTDNKLKCLMFSPGYASNRYLYSVACTELASRGYLVVTIEHKDGSACYTYYYKSKADAQTDTRAHIGVKLIKFGEGHYEERNKQAYQRTDECSRLLDFLIDLNNGTVPYNVLDDVKSNHNINFKLEDLVGQIDLESLTMAGHSFGGATCLLTMSNRKEIKQGILLDPWMFPLKAESHLENITQPLLFVNTQTFHIQPSVNIMAKYLTSDKREMFTILHTTHESQTDTVVVLGYWLNWFMKKINPCVALRINNALMLQFLKKHTGHGESIEDCELYLQEEHGNIVSGLTKPWA